MKGRFQEAAYLGNNIPYTSHPNEFQAATDQIYVQEKSRYIPIQSNAPSPFNFVDLQKVRRQKPLVWSAYEPVLPDQNGMAAFESAEMDGMVFLELDKVQKENEELRNGLVVAERLLPDDRTKIERALYRNPLESIATLLMINERGSVSFGDIEEICGERVLEVLCDCIKSDLITDSDGKLVLTPFTIQYVSELEQIL